MESLSILLVDDDAEVGKMMKMRLAMEAPDMSFHFVEGGMECLEFVKNTKVDCILSDYQMPRMDGMELLLELRKQGSEVPFIFFTGQGSEEIARAAFKSGAYDYFSKEIGFAHFAKIINSIKQAARQSVALKEKTIAEDALLVSGEKYRALIETTNTGFVILDMAGNVVDANDEYVRLTGHNTIDEVLGRNVVEWTSDSDIERNAAEVKKCVEKRFVRNLEISYKGPDGHVTPIEINANLISDAEGGKILTLCRDISERKIMEDVLYENEEKFRTLFESANDCIFIMDGDTFVDCNPRTVEMLGYTYKSELIGHTPMEFSPEIQTDGIRSDAKARSLLEAAYRGAPQRFYWEHKRKDGKLFDTEVSLNRITLKKKTFLLAIVRDITERKP